MASIYKIDCILLDINFGKEKPGIEIMTRLRNLNKYEDIPIIAVTAYFGNEHKQEFLKAGFDDYIAKPFNVDDLEEVLEKFLFHKNQEYN